MIVFDIETGPQPADKLAEGMPEFSAPSTWKDPEKIAAKIEEQKLDYIRKAALDPLTGQVLAVGVLVNDKAMFCLGDNETGVLTAFWELFNDLRKKEIMRRWVGHNIWGFDIPYLVQRSRILQVPIPCTFPMPERYLPRLFGDTMLAWSLGVNGERIGLDRLGKALGVGAKNGNGAHFAETYAADKAAALEYLANDLTLTRKVAERLGVAGYLPDRD